ncbi:unnamed protein product [Tilletia laevis]|uniref:Extracellular membrane protein CFEM domain-containing protein n=2 Tax=Tilletia TaxID=13289 RepID=A0A177UQ64_9BASI|nr:hypothetical protein CF336_g1575 [Tilletia laevis]KAE8263283.1 hypothetical protein A4X03_0g1799 [Tilletia caries]KAE8206438.1 hypothetical protein CF335_g1888 [Tilletia laevis]CAD6891502.1 unnamed protein product [Tilletia caries]CAD6906379.1 unnamed protein product [Tilletia caries]
MRTTSLFSLALLGAAATLVRAQDEPQLDPNATCPQDVIDKVIVPCQAQVYKEEAALPGGACSSSDWSCICSLQQGLISCYDLCTGTQPADQIRFNKQECNGQHGVRNQQNGGSLGYTFGTLTTTLSGYTSTSVPASATESAAQPGSATTASTITTTTSPAASASNTSTSTSITTTAPSSTGTNAAAYGAQPPSRSSIGAAVSFAGLVVGAFMVLAA